MMCGFERGGGLRKPVPGIRETPGGGFYIGRMCCVHAFRVTRCVLVVWTSKVRECTTTAGKTTGRVSGTGGKPGPAARQDARRHFGSWGRINVFTITVHNRRYALLRRRDGLPPGAPSAHHPRLSRWSRMEGRRRGRGTKHATQNK